MRLASFLVTASPLERADLRARVDKALAAFLSRQRGRLTEIDAALLPVADAIEAFVLGGGKRLRPAFAYWGYRAAGGVDGDAVVAAVSALEFVQASALIHDDVMDALRHPARASRRCTGGSPRCTAAGAGSATRRGSATAAAILLGDLCLVWSDELLHGSGLSPDTLARARPVVRRDAHRGDRRAVPRRAHPGHRRHVAASGPAWWPASSRRSTRSSVRCCSAPRSPTRPRRWSCAYSGVRAAAGRGVPAARRRARRVRRPGGHRQAGRRRPARGQAHLPGGGRVRRGRPGRPRRSCGAGLGDPALDAAGVDRLREIITATGALARTEERITELTARPRWPRSTTGARWSAEGVEVLTGAWRPRRPRRQRLSRTHTDSDEQHQREPEGRSSTGAYTIRRPMIAAGS